MDILLELIKLGSVGIISGLFSAYFATRVHRNRKWWELRVEAYKSIIEALSDLTHVYDRKLKAEMEHRELPKDYEAKLDGFSDESYHKVRKAADSGVFLFSKEVNDVLTDFMSLKDEHFDMYHDHLEGYLLKAKNCQKVIVKSANKDLRIKDGWL